MSHSDPFTRYEDEPHIDGGVHHPYTAFNQGFDAHDMGAPLDRNPYEPDSREHRWWLYGWREIDDDNEPEIPTPPSMTDIRRRRAQREKAT